MDWKSQWPVVVGAVGTWMLVLIGFLGLWVHISDEIHDLGDRITKVEVALGRVEGALDILVRLQVPKTALAEGEGHDP